MKIGYEVFLAVADNMNITRAAQQLHVTQQCASDHVQRLEKEYGVRLFERRPRFRLTAAGQAVYAGLRDMKAIEVNMIRNLMEASQEISGSFTLGISTSRAPILMPRILPRYYEEYPKVKISFVEQDTKLLEEELKLGNLDLFLGVNTTPSAEYEIETVAKEPILLVISTALLKRHFSEQEMEEMRQGIDLKKFKNVPFTLANNTGKVTQVIWEYLNYNNIQLDAVYSISDSRTQEMLCSTGLCAALCPKTLIQTAGGPGEEGESLVAFPVKNLERDIHIDVVTRKHIIRPKYIERFIQLIRQEFESLVEDEGRGPEI